MLSFVPAAAKRGETLMKKNQGDRTQSGLLSTLGGYGEEKLPQKESRPALTRPLKEELGGAAQPAYSFSWGGGKREL